MCQMHFTSSPDQLGSVGQKQVWWFSHTALLLDQIHLAQTPTQLVLYNMIQDVCERMQLCLTGKLVEGHLRPARNQAQRFLYIGLLPDSDAFDQTLTRPSRKSRSPRLLHSSWTLWNVKSNQAYLIQPDSGHNTNSHHRPLPKGFQIRTSMFTGEMNLYHELIQHIKTDHREKTGKVL